MIVEAFLPEEENKVLSLLLSDNIISYGNILGMFVIILYAITK